MFVGAQSCPPGYEELKQTQGYLMMGRPEGANAGVQLSRRWTANETFRVGSHSHSVTDPGHGHGVTDPGHGHGVTDPGHKHSAFKFDQVTSAPYWLLDGGTRRFAPVPITTGSSKTGISVKSGSTGVSVKSGSTGVSVKSGSTGISVQDNAEGESHPIIFMLVCVESTTSNSRLQQLFDGRLKPVASTYATAAPAGVKIH